MHSTVLITRGAGNLACQLSGMFEQRGQQVVLINVAKEPVMSVGTGTAYRRVDMTDADALGHAIIDYPPQIILYLCCA